MRLDDILAFLIRLFSGVSSSYLDQSVFHGSRVYYANHSSHLDTAVIWAVLPPTQRRKVSPVGARDYWEKNAFRRWLATKVFNAVLIERQHLTRQSNPIPALVKVLEQHRSLIIFPQGTRHEQADLAGFHSGIYHLARKRRETVFVPVYLHNLNRVLPKGEILPVPIVCKAIFGRGLMLGEEEGRDAFIERARNALEDISEDV